MHRTQEPRLSHCNNFSMRVKCPDSHHSPCAQRNGKLWERQIRSCWFPGNCTIHKAMTAGTWTGHDSAQVGYKWLSNVRSPSHLRKTPIMVYWMNRTAAQGTRRWGKSITQTYAFHNRLPGPCEARNKKETSSLSFLTMISLGRPQAYRKQLASALHLSPHGFRKTCNLNRVYLWQPDHSLWKADRRPMFSMLWPASYFSSLSNGNGRLTRDSSDNTASDHSSLLCSNILHQEPQLDPGTASSKADQV